MTYDDRSLARAFLLDAPRVPVRVLGRPAEPAERGPVPCVLSIGAFDGFHRGHAKLTAAMLVDARSRGVSAVALTFDPDPDCVVGPGPAPKLMAVRDRVASLACAGVDAVAVVPFTADVAALDHERFFEDVVLPVLDVRAIHVGEDFRLGAGGSAGVEAIGAWGSPRGVDVRGHALVSDGGYAISATRIRGLIGAGRLDAALFVLGHPFFVRGRVVTGRGEGAGMGFPTANIEVDGAFQLPADGVYAGFALVGDAAWPAAINAGVPPMFDQAPGSARLEANLLGFSGDIYGEEVRLMFCERLRPSMRFGSIDELIATVKGDIAHVEGMYGTHGRRCAR